jgi:DHA2 family multidrug resistance protein
MPSDATATAAQPEFKLSRAAILVIATAVLASLLEIIDSSIVNVAIPSMMGNLGATLEDISWVVTGYIIANAIVLPIAGWLGMQIGRKKYYVGCILLFTATSVACGLAPNLQILIIFRVLQGFAGGALLPTSQALIQEQFPREKAGMASAIYGMGVIIGPTIGPTLGGYLTDNFGWRAIFNINLPLGLLAAGLAYVVVGDVGDNYADKKPGAPAVVKAARTPIDAFGLMLLAVGIGCLQYVLERGEADDWFDSVAIRLCSLLAISAIPTFVWWELKVKYPIVNLRLFKHSAVRSGTMMMTALGIMLYSTIFILPIFASTVMGFDATQTGMLFIPGALLTGFMMPIVGRMLKNIDARILIFIGIAIVEVFLLMLTQFNSFTTDREIFYPLLVRGFGMAFLFVPINTVVLGQFKGQELGQVAGLMNLWRQIGGSIGIATLSTLLTVYNANNYSNLSAHVSLLNPTTYQAVQQAQGGMGSKLQTSIGEGTSRAAALRSISGRMQKQVFCLSFTQLMWILFAAFGLGLIPLGLMKVDKSKRASGPVLDAH